MMAEFGRIKIFVLLTPVLQITAAVSEQRSDSLIVRAGDDITLPCENVINDHHNCDSTTWLFSGSKNAVTLFEHGQIHKDAMAKSVYSVTANCSLVIKKVTVKDVGGYTCRQFISGQQQGSDSVVYLSVITMTERKDADKVTLRCSLSTYEPCTYTVKWLYEDKDVDNDNQDLKTSQRTCFASVNFGTAKNYKSAKCNVKDSYTGEVQQFTFSRLSAGKDTNVATTMRTVGKNTAESANNDRARNSQDWWWYILVALGLAAILIIVVAALSWRYKANKTQMDDNIALTSNPAVIQSAPKTSQATADLEDSVSYATINYTKKTNSKGRVQGGDEAVTYSTVRVPSSSAGASADPNNLYATIN